MRYWPKNLANYAFNAREVEAVTGVARATQRQWLVRYLDFRQQMFIHHGDVDTGTWSWEGIQLLALFAQSLEDLRDGTRAKAVLMLDPRPGVIRDPLGIFHSDQRRDGESDDLMIVGFLDNAGFGFSTCGASSLPTVGLDGGPARIYAVNFSAFQRALFDAVTRLVDLENGPGALPEAMRV